MLDVMQMLERQKAWQVSRRLLSWPEKLRMAAALRETLHAFARLRASSSRKGADPAAKDEGAGA